MKIITSYHTLSNAIAIIIIIVTIIIIIIIIVIVIIIINFFIVDNKNKIKNILISTNVASNTWPI